MTALPSIVAGLFVYAAIIQRVTHQRSGFAAALAITVMMLPIIIRSVGRRAAAGPQEPARGVLRARHVPVADGVARRAADRSLGPRHRGHPRHRPRHRRDRARAADVGHHRVLNINPFSGPMISLPLQVFDFVRSPEPTMIARGFGTAAVLLVLVLTLFMVARALGGRGAGRPLHRQRRATRALVRDEQRFTARAAEPPPHRRTPAARTRRCRPVPDPQESQHDPSTARRRPRAQRLAAAAHRLWLAASMGARPATAADRTSRSAAPAPPGRRTRSTSGATTWPNNYGMTVNYSRRRARRRVAATSSTAPSTSPSARSRSRHAPRTARRPEKPTHGYAYMPIVAGGTASCTTSRSAASGSRTCGSPARRSPRSSPAASPTGTTRRSRPTTPAWPCRTRTIVPVVRSDGSGTTAQFTLVDVEAVPALWNVLRRRTRHDVAVPELRQRQGAEGLGRRLRLRLAGLRRGRHHLRRVLLRQEGRLPGREGAQRGRLLHRADGPRPSPSPCCKAQINNDPNSPTTSPRSSTASTTTPTSAPTRCRATRT